MINYRFNPAKGIRRQGHPYGELDNFELDSEEYGSFEEWVVGVVEYMLQMKDIDDEQEA